MKLIVRIMLMFTQKERGFLLQITPNRLLLHIKDIVKYIYFYFQGKKTFIFRKKKLLFIKIVKNTLFFWDIKSRS